MYVHKSFESNIAISSMRQMRRILDAKHEKANLNEVTTKQSKHRNDTEMYTIIIFKRNLNICLTVR